MPALLDQNIFTQTNLDSAALTMLGAVLHCFGEPGAYRGVALRNGKAEAAFTLRVDPGCAASQVNIDLATLARRGRSSCRGDSEPTFTVHPKGYAIFHVSQGAGGYAVHVGSIADGPAPKVFDSRSLKAGDIFTATLMRPGTYRATNALNKTHAEIVVSYPTIGKTAYQPGPALSVECTGEGFSPKEIRLTPAQWQVFHCKTAAHLKIELVKPDDGPKRR